MKLTISLAQMQIVLGDTTANLKKRPNGRRKRPGVVLT